MHNPFTTIRIIIVQDYLISEKRKAINGIRDDI